MQIILSFTGSARQQKKWSEEQKLEYDLRLHKELAELYELVTKMTIVCLRKNIPLIIENPYTSQHYLTRYWAIKPKVIDKDRTLRGDYYKKPTQYFFINCEPSQNMIFEPQVWNEKKVIANVHDKVERSMISKDYANRFIREFIIKGGTNDNKNTAIMQKQEEQPKNYTQSQDRQVDGNTEQIILRV